MLVGWLRSECQANTHELSRLLFDHLRTILAFFIVEAGRTTDDHTVFLVAYHSRAYSREEQ